MHKLIMVWLIGAAVLALSPLDTAHAQPADDDQIVGAADRITQIQAILDEEDEGLLDDEELDGDLDEPESQGDVEDDLEDQDAPSDTSDELGSSGEWRTPT